MRNINPIYRALMGICALVLFWGGIVALDKYSSATSGAARAQERLEQANLAADEMNRLIDPLQYEMDKARIYREERLREEYRRR